MFGFLFVVVAIGLAVWAHRASRDLTAAAATRAIIVFALALLLERAALRAGLGRGGVLLPIAAVLGLVAWGAMMRLVACDARRRDAVVRIIFGAFAVVAAISGSVQVAAMIIAPGVVRYAWTRRFDSRAIFRLALGSLALVPLVFWSGDPRGAALKGGSATTFACARWAMLVGEGYLIYGVVVLFRAFIRDPSLGIRTAGRRLALSHVLVVVIPLTLLGGLWAFTTVLGVNSERALVAARIIDGEGPRWEQRLSQSLSADARWSSAAGDTSVWPRDARVWVVRGDSLVRVRGSAVPHEERLRAWTDSLGILYRSGLVSIDDEMWFGAAVRDSTVRGDARARAAIVLLPARAVLEGDAARITGASLSAPINAIRAGNGSVVIGGGPPPGVVPGGYGAGNRNAGITVRDSSDLERVRRVTRRLGMPDSMVRTGAPDGGGLRFTAPSETVDVRRANGEGLRVLMDGHALTRSLAYEHGHWARGRVLITARVAPGAVLAGLYRTLRENPLGFLPIALIGLVTLLVVMVVVFDFAMVANMARSITGAIASLKSGAERLEAGDLAYRIEVRGQDDLWSVADAFNQAVAGLERSRVLEKERARMESELALARQIQARLLPSGPPSVAGFEIAGLSDSARQVGGDYFDHLPVDAHRVLLVIADVSGKGVPASLLMSGFRASLMSQDLAAWDPVALAHHLNDFLVRSVESGKFVTAFLAFADSREGTLDYVNAGHNPPVLMRKDGSHELLTEGGTMFGIIPGAPYTAGRQRFDLDDLLVLYTDGVTEAANAAGAMWGEERLIETLGREHARPCADLARAIAERVRAFEGEQGRADDVTLLIARRTMTPV